MWIFIIKLLIMMALAQLLRPKPIKPSPSGLESFEIPTAEEGRPVSILFGKKRIKGSNVVWYGDFSAHRVEERIKDDWDWFWKLGLTRYFMRSKKVTIGYRYYLGMHLILCHGNADGVKQIWVGEKVVWPTVNDPSVEQFDGTALASISASSVFGGDKKEGGISGSVDIQYGASNQLQNSYLVNKLNDADISAYRGLLGVILNHVYVGASAYIKPWSFLVKRTDKLISGAAQWYPTKAKIGSDDLNAVHIIRECLTDQEWGLGLSTDDINDDNFMACADAAYSEGFGLSAIWDSSSSIEDFIDIILQIIAGSLYPNMATGKWEIKLIRDDYIVGELESFDEDEIIKVDEFGRPGYGEITNQVVVNWWDRINDKGRSVMVHDCTLIEKQSGNTIEMIFDYQAVCDKTLANKIANRELKSISSMLATFRIICNRQMSHLRPGDVFKFSWKNYGITDMPVRILEANYGSLDSNEVSFQCIEDVFGTAYTIYTNPLDTEWEDPVHDPVDTVHRLLMETPYFILCNILGQDMVTDLDNDAAAMLCCAVKPISDAYAFVLMARLNSSSEWENYGTDSFIASATIKNDLPKAADDVETELENIVDQDQISGENYAIIGNEIVSVLSISGDKITIARGVFDTTPDFHFSGSRIWFIESEICATHESYTNGDTPQVRFLTETGKGTLAESSASVETASAFNSRMIRPYLPGNLKINGQRYPVYLYGQPTLTWSHRDRTDPDQIDNIVKQTDATNYGPEVGATYTLKIYGRRNHLQNQLLRTVSGLSGTSYIYTQVDEIADSLEDCISHRLRFVLFSTRGGYNSLQEYDVTVERPLYGHIDAQGSAMGNLAGSQKIAGSYDATSSASANLNARKLSGECDATSSIVANITES